MRTVPDAVKALATDDVKIVRVNIQPVPEHIHVKRYARAEDGTTRIEGSTIFVDAASNLVIGAYIRTGTHWADLAATCLAVRDGGEMHRQNGMSGETKVFGYMPRKKGRQDWCRPTMVCGRHNDVEKRLEEIGTEISKVYQALNPTLYAEHQELAKRVLDEYLMGGGPYTSGIINFDYSIPYHYDRGNFPGMWNAMVVTRRDCSGGETVFPELGVTLAVEDGSLALFNAQNFIHGVTPIRKLTRMGYRFSVVWYSLEQLWKCMTSEEELVRYRKTRTEQEYARLANKPKGRT